jgi:crotonobetainyl-CoA:carnitine CoA-transferase CaiB-like acyl-CoA transferase
MAASTLVAVAGEPEEQSQPGGVTIADIMAVIEETQAIHPEWFKSGLGWGKQPEEKAK